MWSWPCSSSSLNSSSSPSLKYCCSKLLLLFSFNFWRHYFPIISSFFFLMLAFSQDLTDEFCVGSLRTNLAFAFVLHPSLTLYLSLSLSFSLWASWLIVMLHILFRRGTTYYNIPINELTPTRIFIQFQRYFLFHWIAIFLILQCIS